jgi:hypothetical protein
VFGKEAKTVLKKLPCVLSEKWGKSYSEVCGYVNARVSIAIIRATHLCLRGSRVATSRMSNHRPQWEDKAGLSLFRHYEDFMTALIRFSHCFSFLHPITNPAFIYWFPFMFRDSGHDCFSINNCFTILAYTSTVPPVPVR